jgi:hypothetical protein
VYNIYVLHPKKTIIVLFFIHTVQQIGLSPTLVNDVDGDNTKKEDI